MKEIPWKVSYRQGRKNFACDLNIKNRFLLIKPAVCHIICCSKYPFGEEIEAGKNISLILFTYISSHYRII